jgi:hypothetical protein
MIINLYIKHFVIIYKMSKLFPFYCLFAYMAIIAHFMIIFNKFGGKQETKLLSDSLNENQQKVYEKIKLERRNHFMIGLVIGLIISFIHMFFMIPRGDGMKVCSFIGLSMLVANSVYLLLPKSLWLVEHLENMEQVKLWNNVYKKFRCMTNYGYLIGFVLYMITHFV